MRSQLHHWGRRRGRAASWPVPRQHRAHRSWYRDRNPGLHGSGHNRLPRRRRAAHALVHDARVGDPGRDHAQAACRARCWSGTPTPLPTAHRPRPEVAADCPLPRRRRGFLGANGTPERSIVLAIAKDIEGNAVTGAIILWSTDDKNKGVMAAPLTPTLDLGSFGFGAPNILCGTVNTGTVTVRRTSPLISSAVQQSTEGVILGGHPGDADQEVHGRRRARDHYGRFGPGHAAVRRRRLLHRERHGGGRRR